MFSIHLIHFLFAMGFSGALLAIMSLAKSALLRLSASLSARHPR